MAQAEYRYIEAHGGKRANCPWWCGFAPSAWTLKSLLDCLLPCIVSAAFATFATVSFTPNPRTVCARQAMATTSGCLEIYNMALGFVGARTIGSPNEHTPEAIQCGLFWDRARRSALRDYPYRFALRRFRLPEKDVPDVYSGEWTHCYGIPDGVLKVLRIHAGAKRGLNKVPYSIQRGDEGEIVLCDVERAMIDAVVDVEDLSQWDDAFAAAMARKLACLICVPLTKGEGKLNALTQAYQASIPVAEGADASESYDRRPDDAWLLARGGW